MIPATRRWEPAKLPPRVARLQRELDARRRPRYLEIGVNKGRTFLSVEAAAKVARPGAPVPRADLEPAAASATRT